MTSLFQKSNESIKRTKWIDVLRGVCILLVVTGHLTSNEAFHIYANQIKMPLFYVLAGLFIKPNKKPLTFLKDSAFRLGIPWVIFSLVWIRVPADILLHTSDKTAVDTLADFLRGKDYWFIPSFFVTQNLFMILYKLCRGKKAFLMPASLGLFVVGYLTAEVSWLIIWCINTAFTGVIFIFIGFLLRDYLKYLDSMKPVYAVIGVCVYALLCFIGCIISPSASLDFHNVQYGNLPLNILLVLVGIGASVAASVCLCRKCKFTGLSMIGRNTLVIYLLSTFLHVGLNKVFQVFGISMKQVMNGSIIIALVTGLLIGAFATVVSEICGCVMPWSIGLKRSNMVRSQLSKG